VRCPKCGGPLGHADLTPFHPFRCKHCRVKLAVPRWYFSLFSSAAAIPTYWLLWVRSHHLFSVLVWGLVLTPLLGGLLFQLAAPLLPLPLRLLSDDQPFTVMDIGDSNP